MEYLERTDDTENIYKQVRELNKNTEHANSYFSCEFYRKDFAM